jgi:hypothetical protein
MSRELSDAVANALDDAVVYPFFAVELLFDGKKSSIKNVDRGRNPCLRWC